MSCQDFVEKMQDRLDQRLPLDGDREIVDHARGCASCSAHLRAWQSIELVVSPKVTTPSQTRQSTGRLPHYRVASIAASAFLAFGLLAWSQSKTDQQLVSVGANLPAVPEPIVVEPMEVAPIASAPIASPPMIAAPIASIPAASTPIESMSVVSSPSDFELSEESVEWWKSVGQGEWFAHSMPTVRSMHEGAAPFRKSLMQIVSLLTFGRPDSIVLPEPASVQKATVESRQTS